VRGEKKRKDEGRKEGRKEEIKTSRVKSDF
jgi:hypothetical protein